MKIEPKVRRRVLFALFLVMLTCQLLFQKYFAARTIALLALAIGYLGMEMIHVDGKVRGQRPERVLLLSSLLFWWVTLPYYVGSTRGVKTFFKCLGLALLYLLVVSILIVVFNLK